jgi:uncharacterized protein YjbJ (UPF0337 family)
MKPITQKITDSSKSGNTDKIEGDAKVFSGKVKEDTGRVFRSPTLEAKGDLEQDAGHIQKQVGNGKKAFGQ